MQSDRPDDTEVSPGRRNLLKAIATAGGFMATRVLLPGLWSSPIIAAMELPAHACTSPGGTTTTCPPKPDGGAGAPNTNDTTCAQGVDPPAGVTVTEGTAITAGPVTKSSTNAGMFTVTLTITPPAVLITNRTEYQLWEKFTSNGMTCARIVELLVPSAPSISGTVTSVLTRAAGSYAYQLRWTGGYTAYVPVGVQ